MNVWELSILKVDSEYYIHKSWNFMVEVFKTNVKYQEEADGIVDQIRQSFEDYDANFDLEDCDKILRVCSATKKIDSKLIIKLVQSAGFTAEILDDDTKILIPRFFDIKSDLIILTTSLSFLIS